MTALRIAGFDWDDGNWIKCQKHGLAIEDIEAAFRLDALLVMRDEVHSGEEPRFVLLARDSEDHPIFVCFTLRGAERSPLIRPISARRMHKKELVAYEARRKRGQ